MQGMEQKISHLEQLIESKEHRLEFKERQLVSLEAKTHQIVTIKNREYASLYQRACICMQEMQAKLSAK